MKFMVWSAYALIGLLVGLTAACMANIEHHLIHLRKVNADSIISGDEGNLVKGWLLFSGLSLVCVIIAVTMTVYYGPSAYGSGIADIIAYLNGVNLPGVISF